LLNSEPRPGGALSLSNFFEVTQKRPKPPVGGHTLESNEFGDIFYWQPGNPRPKSHWCFMLALEAWFGDCGHIIGEA